MRYLLFKKSLLNIMGDDARINPISLGLEMSPTYQFKNANYTIAKIVVEELAIKYVSHPDCEVLTLEQANAKIDELYEYTYSVYNEGLMSANINQKISAGLINLDEMDPEWTNSQEAEWLYNQGINGIKKSVKPPYFTE